VENSAGGWRLEENVQKIVRPMYSCMHHAHDKGKKKKKKMERPKHGRNKGEAA